MGNYMYKVTKPTPEKIKQQEKFLKYKNEPFVKNGILSNYNYKYVSNLKKINE